MYIITFFAEGVLPQNLTDGVLNFTAAQQIEFGEIFSRIFTFYNKDERSMLEGQECMDSFTSFLIRVSFDHKGHTENSLLDLSQNAREYKNVMTVMTQHLYDNCSLEEIAAYCNMSVSNIKVLFRKFSGISPKLQYSRLRTSEAIKLMSKGMSASETANKLNFSSPNYFNTFFRRMTGMPPAAFNRNSNGVSKKDGFSY